MEELILLLLMFVIAVLGLYALYERSERILATKGYYSYLYTRRWIRKSFLCKWRAGFKCQVCGSPYDLNAHHNTYAHLYNEPKEDLLCLCRDCHQLFSTNGKLWKPAGKYRVVILSPGQVLAAMWRNVWEVGLYALVLWTNRPSRATAQGTSKP